MSDAGMRLAPGTSPIATPVQMFVAAVDPVAGPKVFDPSRMGRFAISSPPAGWYALGALTALERQDTGEFAEVWSGAPATLSARGRSRSGAALRCGFANWSKLALALSSGSQQMNLLRTAAAFTPANSGGTGESTPVLGGSTDTVLRVSAAFAVSAGDRVVVDVDYAGQVGAVGSPIAGARISDPARVNNDAQYVRRVSFNVGVVASVATDARPPVQVLTLAQPLPAGVPAGAMQVSVVLGFADRVGGTFLSEWSVLLLADGVAGERVLLHYPRVQTAGGQSEQRAALAAGLERWRLEASLVALPVRDGNDGDAVLCYRSFLPAPGRS